MWILICLHFIHKENQPVLVVQHFTLHRGDKRTLQVQFKYPPPPSPPGSKLVSFCIWGAQEEIILGDRGRVVGGHTIITPLLPPHLFKLISLDRIYHVLISLAWCSLLWNPSLPHTQWMQSSANGARSHISLSGGKCLALTMDILWNSIYACARVHIMLQNRTHCAFTYDTFDTKIVRSTCQNYAEWCFRLSQEVSISSLIIGWV